MGRAVSSRVASVASALVVTGLLLVPAPNAAAADPFAIRVQREIYAVVPFQRQVFFLGDKGRAPLLLYGEGQSPIECRQSAGFDINDTVGVITVSVCDAHPLCADPRGTLGAIARRVLVAFP